MFFVPETKAIPLEEMARMFGDEVAVYEADIHTDQRLTSDCRTAYGSGW